MIILQYEGLKIRFTLFFIPFVFNFKVLKVAYGIFP